MKRFCAIFTILLVLVICHMSLAQVENAQAEKARVNNLLASCQRASESLHMEAIEASQYRTLVNQNLIAKANLLILTGKSKGETAFQSAVAELAVQSTPNRGLIRIKEFQELTNGYVEYFKDSTDCYKVRIFYGIIRAQGTRILCQLSELEGTERQYPECKKQLLDET